MRLIFAPPDSSTVSTWSPEPSIRFSKSTENCCTILEQRERGSAVASELGVGVGKISAVGENHEKTRRLTAAAAWFCGTGHRVGIPGIPLPPCPEPTAGTAACCGNRAGCPGCGWSVAMRGKRQLIISVVITEGINSTTA